MIVLALAAPDSTELQIDVVVALPALSRAERLALGAAARTALRDTKEYGRKSILAISPSGTIARVAEDHLRLSFAVAPERSSEGLALLESALVRPAFLAKSLAEAATWFGGDAPSPWARASRAPVALARAVKPEEARAIWSKVIRSERLTIAFSGPGSEAARARWLARKIVWPVKPPERYVPADKPLPVPSDAAVAVLEQEAKLDGPTLLAAAALGMGKGSLGWRVLRTESGMSYRPEAVVAGTTEGWALRLRFDVSAPEESAAGREALLKAVDSLAEADRTRAAAYLAAGLTGDAADSPLELSPAEMRERGYLSALFAAKGGGNFDPVMLSRSAGRVTLDELKARLRSFLEGARIELR